MALLLATAFSVVTLAESSSPAAAHHCGSYKDKNGNLVPRQCAHTPPGGGGGDGGGDGGDGGDGGGGGGGGERPACPDWRPLGGYDSVPPHIRPYPWDDAPEGSTFYYDACTSPNGFGPGSTTMWLPPGAAPAPIPPTPAEVAEGLWVEVQATLLRPDPVTSPDLGEPSVINIPTFVAVSNWQGTVERGRCELGVCIELVATPTLQFDPGEPEAGTIDCDPPGTYFDPDGPEPDEQAAAPGACTHTYRRRTGVGNRPDQWPGQVSVVWDVDWTQTGGDDSGDFSATLSTDVPRAVQEVTTVVEDVDGGGGRG